MMSLIVSQGGTQLQWDTWPVLEVLRYSLYWCIVNVF